MPDDIYEKYREGVEGAPIEEGIPEPGEPTVEIDAKKPEAEERTASEEAETRLQKEKLKREIARGEAPAQGMAEEVDKILELAEKEGIARALETAGEKQDKEFLGKVVLGLIENKGKSPEEILRVAEKMDDPWALDTIVDHLRSLKHV